jgi:hydrogenase nickel incorporation protein HypA/HybF
VHPDALQFSYGLIIDGTTLAGSELAIQETPVIVYCNDCRRELALPGIQCFLCPACGGGQTDVRQGFEMELESLVIESD